MNILKKYIHVFIFIAEHSEQIVHQMLFILFVYTFLKCNLHLNFIKSFAKKINTLQTSLSISKAIYQISKDLRNL